MKVRNLLGQQFGQLCVVRREKSTKRGQARWRVACICGAESVVQGTDLTGGKTKSCGCRRKLSEGESMRKRILATYKIEAMKRNHSWELPEEIFFQLIKEDCHYCGQVPMNVARAVGANGEYCYNGIDRVDNQQGYVVTNVVPCCAICNRAKKGMTYRAYQAWLSRIRETAHNVVGA